MTAPHEMTATPPADEKERALVAWLQERGSALLGYSGGVDSAYLASVATEALGPDRILAVIGRSASYPEEQWRTAWDVAAQIGFRVEEVDTAEMADPRYVANPSNRCYFCKTELWSRLGVIARRYGLRTVADGSNADDRSDHRPGTRAALEHGVRSPLQEAGLGKAEIRRLSRRLGLPTWDQPASPCLASRLPYGLAVTPERLDQVERAEQALREQGLRELRVRHHGDAARIEVAPEELDRAAAVVHRSVDRLLALGFRRVLLDVEGYRRGALNEALVQLGMR